MPQPVSLFAIDSLLPAIAARQVIITPNQRLASRITAAYAIYAQQQGHAVTMAPAIYSLQQWMQRCWRQLLITADAQAIALTPLSAEQELLLWEKIVRESEQGSALLRPTATAQQAMAAYRLLAEWQQLDVLPSLAGEFLTAEDTAISYQWLQRFERDCDSEKWLASAGQYRLLQRAFADGRLAPQGEIVCVAFDVMTPAAAALLQQAGGFSQHDELPQSDSVSNDVAVVCCEHFEEEMLAAAVWAKQALRFDETARVAVVVPELSRCRQQVQRIFQQVFEGEYNYPLAGDQQLRQRRNLPFNMSAATVLLEAPVFTAALDVLALLSPSLPLAQLERLLQSPFTQLQVFAGDAAAVASLLQRVRNERSFDITPARLRQLAEQVAAEQAEQSWHWSRRLQKVAELQRRLDGRAQTPLAWLDVFNKLLAIVGWPGERVPDSIEYQQLQQWQVIQESFAGLEVLIPGMTLEEALQQLRSLLSRHAFQPQTADSRLQILGILEASGLQFSHLWLSSMSARQWPLAPSPNPFLPYGLQRRLQMPNASVEREFDYARQLSRRFLVSAEAVVVSYPAQVDDNPVMVSQLFAQYPQQTLTELLGKPLQNRVPLREIRRRHQESAVEEVVSTDRAPVLAGDQLVAMKGGTRILADQAVCPFRAFARHRLQARSLEEPQLGLGHRERGLLLHRVLDLLWAELQSRQRLLALSDDERTDLVARVCTSAVEELQQASASRFGRRLLALEQQRLQQLVLVWLQVEQTRQDFTVLAREHSQSCELAGLPLRMRIDRVDQLADNSLVVIDYKTGMTSVNQWWGARPDEPQLPLYSLLTMTDLTSQYPKEQFDAVVEGDQLTTNGPVKGAAFAQVRLENAQFAGVADAAIAEPLLQWQATHSSASGAENWEALQHHWLRVLTVLAEDFIAGKALVDPKAAPATCDYCDLASLCRIEHQELPL